MFILNHTFRENFFLFQGKKIFGKKKEEKKLLPQEFRIFIFYFFVYIEKVLSHSGHYVCIRFEAEYSFVT